MPDWHDYRLKKRTITSISFRLGAGTSLVQNTLNTKTSDISFIHAIYAILRGA
jgi:hypothetical protein